MPTSLFPSPKKTNNAIHHLSSPQTPSHTIFSDAMMQENIEKAETIIRKWIPMRNLDSSKAQFMTSLFQENREEAQEFVLRVHGLRKAMHFLISQHPNSNKLVLANELMKIAMSRLQNEFHQILSSNNEDYSNPESDSSGSSRLPPSSRSSDDEDSFASNREVWISKAMSDLKMIAGTMISSGYSKECVTTYKTIRKSFIHENLSRLGIDSCASTQMINRMDSETLERHVSKWKLAAKTAVRTLFRGERFLCDHVFAISETFQQTCVAHVLVEGALSLFRFPENVAKSKRSPSKIFPLLNLYEAVSDLLPDMETIFSYEEVSAVKMRVLSIIDKLGKSIKKSLSDFVSTTQRNSSKTAVPGGGIHPLSFTVMNFVSLLAENSTILSEILTGNTETPPFPLEFEIPNPTTAVAGQLAWIVLVLLCKLDSKAEEAYNDVGLSYLFLANNIQFVVDKIKSCPSLKFLLGDQWLSKIETKIRIHAGKYESVCWGNAFSCLTAVEEKPPEIIRERIRKFNSAFEAEYRKQSTWVVQDPKLRDEIKVSLARKMVPAYREFYNSFMAVLKGGDGKDLEPVVRFSPENLGNYLSDLFHPGAAVSVSAGLTSRSRISRCL